MSKKEEVVYVESAEELFADLEKEIIDDVMKHIKNGDIDPALLETDPTIWKARQLQELQKWKKENRKKLKSKDHSKKIANQIEKELNDAYGKGKKKVENQIKKAIASGGTIQNPGYSAFNAINQRKLNALMAETKEIAEKVEYSAYGYAAKEYQGIITKAAAYQTTGLYNFAQSIDMATKSFLAAGINSIEYKDGKQMNISSYSQMAIRTATKRAYLQGEAAKRDEWGIATVRINRRTGGCPLCMEWVGKVLWDNVYSSYGSEHPEDNTEGYPLLSDAIAAGLYHPNCRDSHSTYYPGISTEYPPVTKAEKDEAQEIYEKQQEQRYNERQIRKYKDLYNGALSEEDQRKYSTKIKEWQGKNNKLVKDNPEILKREYEREKVYTTPVKAGKSKFESLYDEKTGKFKLVPDMTEEEQQACIDALSEQYDTINAQFHEKDDKYLLLDKDKSGYFLCEADSIPKNERKVQYGSYANTNGTYAPQLMVKDKKELYKDKTKMHISDEEYKKAIEYAKRKNKTNPGKSYSGIGGDAAEIVYKSRLEKIDIDDPSFVWEKNSVPGYAANDIGKYQIKNLTSSAQLCLPKRTDDGRWVIYKRLDKAIKENSTEKEWEEYLKNWTIPEHIIKDVKSGKIKVN